MRDFTNATTEQYAELEAQARGVCIRFRGQELPRGCRPGSADVGFELDADGGEARLLIARDVRYDGADTDIRQWVSEGQLDFPSFAALVAWLRGPLKRALETERGAETGGGDGQGRQPATTDVDAVREGLRDVDRAIHIDEDEFSDRMRSRVLGQDAALRTLSGVVVRHTARVRPARPAVVFAIGPSGVGKTRTAEVLAEELRQIDTEGAGFQYLRLDMSEYQEAHRVSQLLGAPQGYVGHGDGSQLVDALRANPCTVVLFDEMEKAHPSIMRVLMNAMDAGRLSTSAAGTNGRDIDCSRAIFMFTSNIDASATLDELDARDGFGDRAVEDDVCRRRLRAAGLAPEIVGRIGRFLVYRPLTTETRAAIVTLSIGEVAEEYGVGVAYVDPAVVIELVRGAGSGGFGVRPERYLIDDMLGTAFATAARDDVQQPVAVSGPPWQCVPHVTSNAQDGEDNNNTKEV